MPDQKRPTESTSEPGGSLDFETHFTALNMCVADLESGRLSLDDSLSAYRRGIELVRKCRTLLEQAQARVELIEEVDPKGDSKSTSIDLDVESHVALRSPSRQETNTTEEEDRF